MSCHRSPISLVQGEVKFFLNDTSTLPAVLDELDRRSGQAAALRNDSILRDHESTLRSAGRILGKKGKASTEDVRQALAPTHPDLAQRWSRARQGSRYVAHPDDSLREDVLQVLQRCPRQAPEATRDSEEYSGKSSAGSAQSAPDVFHAKAKTQDVKDPTEDISDVHARPEVGMASDEDSCAEVCAAVARARRRLSSNCSSSASSEARVAEDIDGQGKDFSTSEESLCKLDSAHAASPFSGQFLSEKIDKLEAKLDLVIQGLALALPHHTSRNAATQTDPDNVKTKNQDASSDDQSLEEPKEDEFVEVLVQQFQETLIGVAPPGSAGTLHGTFGEEIVSQEGFDEEAIIDQAPAEQACGDVLSETVVGVHVAVEGGAVTADYVDTGECSADCPFVEDATSGPDADCDATFFVTRKEDVKGKEDTGDSEEIADYLDKMLATYGRTHHMALEGRRQYAALLESSASLKGPRRKSAARELRTLKQQVEAQEAQAANVRCELRSAFSES